MLNNVEENILNVNNCTHSITTNTNFNDKNFEHWSYNDINDIFPNKQCNLNFKAGGEAEPFLST